MLKKEYYALCGIEETLSMIVHYHNKNLNQSQYNALENCMNKVKELLKSYNSKRLKRMMKELGEKTYEEIIKKEFGL